MAKRKPVNRGWFRKGKDPRRHKFTPEECQQGYENAILSLAEKYPDAKCQHGAHFSHCLLRVKSPAWFEIRKLQHRVTKLEAKVGKHDKKLRSIQRELRKLQKQKGYNYIPRNTKPERKVQK